MGYYNEGRYYVDIGGRLTREAADRVEKTHLTALDARVKVLEERENKIVKQVKQNKDDVKQAYDLINNLIRRIDYCEEGANLAAYLLKQSKAAPTVSKKRRRVTVCAGNQTVEIARND